MIFFFFMSLSRVFKDSQTSINGISHVVSDFRKKNVEKSLFREYSMQRNNKLTLTYFRNLYFNIVISIKSFFSVNFGTISRLDTIRLHDIIVYIQNENNCENIMCRNVYIYIYIYVYICIYIHFLYIYMCVENTIMRNLITFAIETLLTIEFEASTCVERYYNKKKDKKN